MYRRFPYVLRLVAVLAVVHQANTIQNRVDIGLVGSGVRRLAIVVVGNRQGIVGIEHQDREHAHLFHQVLERDRSTKIFTALLDLGTERLGQ